MEKIFCTFCRKSCKDSKTVLYIYIYINIYIYLYIYIKLSPKWINCHEQKVFLFGFYILCENFSKIGPIIKKWGAKGVHRRSKLTFFNVYFHYLFIYLIYSYFQILLVCEEC